MAKFTTETRRAFYQALAAGMTQAEAAAEAKVSLRSVKGWLAKGRKAKVGEHADFAAAVDALAVAGKTGRGDLTPEEHRELVAERCRNGSDQALKLYWEMIRADSDEDEEAPADPLAEYDTDELAARRAAQ